MTRRTQTLLAAYRTLKSTFTIYHLPVDLIPIKDYDKWISRRSEVIQEICYDIYDKILNPCIEDNKNGKLSRDEQRMLAKIIQMVAWELDYCPLPWDADYRREKDFDLTLEHLNKIRQTIIKFIDTLEIKTIKQFVNKAGDFIKCIAPKTVFHKHKIIFQVYIPEDTVYELTLNDDRGKLNVCPIVYGRFFSYGEKRVNIETGEVINKVIYDLYNHTIDLKSIR